MERYKFLYELSQKALDQELERYKKLDEKASRFLSILSVGIVAYTALINASASKTFVPGSPTWPSWIFVGVAAVTFIALFSSWLRIFTSIRLADVPKVAIGTTANKLADEEDLITMYYQLAMSCQEVKESATKRLTDKTYWLQSAYKEIQFSTYSLIASLASYFLVVLIPKI
ncbi:hypothetical protein GIV19_15320 [Pseudomonas syringae]|uniref:hypothetical protein n=1 Tax=Pseudomonas syringae TaxID=317 RepID=UPI001F43BFD0|nr:hypothetical protein [Pseudomonas syringae]MCF5708656.1 hypothetical protein [Pseudomonas syringae]